jgi:hypothetical protein
MPLALAGLFSAQIARCTPESARRSACAVAIWLLAIIGSLRASTANDTINPVITTSMIIASGMATPRSLTSNFTVGRIVELSTTRL